MSIHMKKIPDNAKKVFEGVIFDMYHWEQEMFDGSKSVFEAIRRHPSVTIIAATNNKIIFNNEQQPGKLPFSTLPGGQVEGEETPLSTAKRELIEETGFESDSWEEWFVADASNMSKLEWNIHYFVARNCIKKTEPHLDGGEKIETTFLSLEELLEKRRGMTNRSAALEERLEKAANDETEKQKLQDLLGITT